MIFNDLRNGSVNQVWNNYDKNIDHSILDEAEKVYNELIKNDLNPHIVLPLTNGNIQFEWHIDNKYLELEFVSNEKIHYLKYWNNEFTPEESDLSIKDLSKIIKLVYYFLQ